MSTREIAGYSVNVDQDGFLTDPSQWNREIAAALAAENGIPELGPDHWKVIDFCRADFVEKGESPAIRRITKVAGVGTKEMYQLFPKGPGKLSSLIAGLPKPKGCI